MPDCAQVLNHLLQQASSEANALVFRQERKNDNFAGSSVTEAIPNQTALCPTDIAWQDASRDICAPTGSRDSNLAQPGLRNGVLARATSKSNTLRGVTAQRRTQGKTRRLHGVLSS